MDLETAQLDRACGVLLAAAAGDALSVENEPGAPPPPDAPTTMKSDSAPGEWTDDTFRTLVVAEVAASGADLRTASAQAAIRARWGKDAGSGPLTWAAPVALAFLDDPDGLTEAATAIGALTDDTPEAGEARMLWCHAIRHAVLTGTLDVRVGLERLPEPGRTRWVERLRKAERARPRDFTRTGQAAEALQAAWCAITTTAVPQDEPVDGSFRVDHLRLALEDATLGRRDAGAVAGGLLGAAYGASAVPARWRLDLRGRSERGPQDLIALAAALATGGTYAPPVYGGGDRPAITVPHPDDPGVLLADLAAVRDLPATVTAVVSLCPVGEQERRTILARTPHWIEVRLADCDEPADNPNLDFVLHDTVTAIEQLRTGGHVVLVHCVAAYSRTPTIGALYAMRRTGADRDQAIAAMERALPEADPTDAFRAALRRARPDNGWLARLHPA
ncbi:ADP-ribosylglycohydrolase family protein [Actinomadura sp. 9N215]|uniref:ADP-ribosylglycohydrolase family protein n=1 Tax=Actinomadura sp. 9N215 TaxID=3375150 RepID=UPI003796FFE1